MSHVILGVALISPIIEGRLFTSSQVPLFVLAPATVALYVLFSHIYANNISYICNRFSSAPNSISPNEVQIRKDLGMPHNRQMFRFAQEKDLSLHR